jgi:hypothetical protein
MRSEGDAEIRRLLEVWRHDERIVLHRAAELEEHLDATKSTRRTGRRIVCKSCHPVR